MRRNALIMANLFCFVGKSLSARGRLILWYRAFKGFYDRNSEDNLDFVTRFLFSARSIILVISAQAAIISGLLTVIFSSFNALRFVVLFIGFIDAHALSNLSNDYFGYFRGDDSPDSPRRLYTIHPIADGVITRGEAKASLIILLLIGIAIAAYFTVAVGLDTLLFFGIGVVLLFFYDAAPVPLKAIGLGEIASFLAWGPVMIAGGYFVISGNISILPIIAGIPYGLGVMSILWGKHIDQEVYDSRKKIKTMPVLLGTDLSRKIGTAIIILVYVVAGVSIIFGFLPLTCIIIVGSVPAAIMAIRRFGSPMPQSPPPGFVGWPLWFHRGALNFNKRFGWTYILSLLIAAVLIHIGHVSGYVILRI